MRRALLTQMLVLPSAAGLAIGDKRIFLPGMNKANSVAAVTGPNYLLGVHCLDDFGDTDGANHAAKHGASVIVVLGNKSGAVELKHRYPNVSVVFRAPMFDYKPTIDQMIHLFNLKPADPPLMYVGLNEGDQNVNNSPAGVRERAAFDNALALRLASVQPNAVYIAGSFAHGNPAFADPAVCTAFREAYAPGYNSGRYWFDLHNYTLGRRSGAHPPSGAQINPSLWYERRWEYLFSHCGFDPNIRHIVSTESGVEAGSGGFPWADYSNAQFAEWLGMHREIQRTPLILDSGVYNSPYRWGAIYQYGRSARWASYDVRRYFPELKSEWARR